MNVEVCVETFPIASVDPNVAVCSPWTRRIGHLYELALEGDRIERLGRDERAVDEDPQLAHDVIVTGGEPDICGPSLRDSPSAGFIQ